jgi:hypothetical protein
LQCFMIYTIYAAWYMHYATRNCSCIRLPGRQAGRQAGKHAGMKAGRQTGRQAGR